MWKSFMSLAALTAAVVQPVVMGQDTVSFASIIWKNPNCTEPEHDAEGLVVTLVRSGVTATKVICLGADKAPVSDKDPHACTGEACTITEFTLEDCHGLDVQDDTAPLVNSEVCWGCTGGDQTITGDPPKLGASWSDGVAGDAWVVCTPPFSLNSLKWIGGDCTATAETSVTFENAVGSVSIVCLTGTDAESDTPAPCTGGDNIACDVSSLLGPTCEKGIKATDAGAQPAAVSVLCWDDAGAHDACSAVSAFPSIPVEGDTWDGGEALVWTTCDKGSAAEVKMTSINWEHPDCEDITVEAVKVKVLHSVEANKGEEVKVSCWDGSQEVGTAATCTGDEVECVLAGVNMKTCTGGLKVASTDTAPLNYFVCWGDNCATADVTMDIAPVAGDSWAGVGTAWVNCNDESSAGVRFTEISWEDDACSGIAMERSVVKVMNDGVSKPVTVSCLTASGAHTTPSPCAGDGSECVLAVSLELCTEGLKVDDDDTAAASVVCWKENGQGCTGATMIDAPLKGDKWSGSGTSWTNCNEDGGGSSSVLGFDTVVRISNRSCRATDIGRDYLPEGGPDDETTTTLAPEDAVEHDSLYLDGPYRGAARAVKITCSLSTGDPVVKNVNAVIPGLVNLRHQTSSDDPPIDLKLCEKLKIETADNTDPIETDTICFKAGDTATDCVGRIYEAIPSTSDSSLDARKPPSESTDPLPKWIEVKGEGCNVVVSEPTTSEPESNSLAKGGGMAIVGVLLSVIVMIN